MLRNQAIGGGGAVCDLNRTAVAPLSASCVVYSSSSSPPYVKGGKGVLIGRCLVREWHINECRVTSMEVHMGGFEPATFLSKCKELNH